MHIWQVVQYARSTPCVRWSPEHTHNPQPTLFLQNTLSLYCTRYRRVVPASTYCRVSWWSRPRCRVCRLRLSCLLYVLLRNIVPNVHFTTISADHTSSLCALPQSPQTGLGELVICSDCEVCEYTTNDKRTKRESTTIRLCSTRPALGLLSLASQMVQIEVE
jgi:hypothetical protein